MHSIPPAGQPIFWIRHGETNYNNKGIVQGSAIDAELSEKGWEQAKAFYQAYKHIPFKAIFTTPLIRTKQTVSFFTKNSNIPVYEIPELTEIFWGNWEGKKVSDLQQEIDECYNQWQQGNTNYNPYNGESPEDVMKRVNIAIDKIFSLAPKGPILVCAHSRISRIVFTKLFGYELKYMYLFGLKNTALNLITRHKDYFLLHKFNDITHLLLCESL